MWVVHIFVIYVCTHVCTNFMYLHKFMYIYATVTVSCIAQVAASGVGSLPQKKNEEGAGGGKKKGGGGGKGGGRKAGKGKGKGQEQEEDVGKKSTWEYKFMTSDEVCTCQYTTHCECVLAHIHSCTC